MKINKLILENFGIYKGKNEFDLTTSKDKNIILIGGKNGNGKTTFFTAIRLCFYGQNAFEKNLSKKQYEKYLNSKIHNNPNLNIKYNYAMIEIEFEQIIDHQLKKYKINRKWEFVDDEIIEFFNVYENDKKLEDLDEENWQDFINNLIPKGLSELYFFDGEKIQNLVDDKTNNSEFRNSFKSLLGLENVEKLQVDLEIFLNKKIKSSASKEIRIKFSEKEKEIIEKEHKIQFKFQELSKLNSEFEINLKEINKIEEKISSEGGKFSEKRDKIKKRITELETEIKTLEDGLREDCNKLLPFFFSKDLLSKIKERINNEEKYKKEIIVNEIISKKINNVKNKLDNKTLELLNKEFIPKIKPIKIIHQISENEKIKILSVIENINSNYNSNSLIEFNKKHNKLISELELREKELTYAANDDLIKPYIEKINALNQKLGSIKNKINLLEEELKKLSFEKSLLENELKKIKDEIKNEEHLKLTIERIKKIQNTLSEYYNILKEKKLKEFEKEFIKKFNLISRKKGAYKKIEVNPETFDIQLIKNNDLKISKQRLSEGEKQIYALSVLWTLTSLSKREFPFVIDTPLGRLDHSHRSTLINSFFPKISKQLIILSTDTEIDEKYYKSLKEHISKEYLLEEDNGSTTIKGGYFF